MVQCSTSDLKHKFIEHYTDMSEKNKYNFNSNWIKTLELYKEFKLVYEV